MLHYTILYVFKLINYLEQTPVKYTEIGAWGNDRRERPLHDDEMGGLN